MGPHAIKQRDMLGRFIKKGRVSYLAGKGFTLIEVMVAMAIVALAVTVIIELFSSGLRLAGMSQEYSRAVFYGRQLLEEICLKKDIAEGSDQGVFEGDFTWRYEIKPHEVLIEEDETDTGFALTIYRITVTVLWLNGAKQKELSFETLKTVVKAKKSGETSVNNLF